MAQIVGRNSAHEIHTASIRIKNLFELASAAGDFFRLSVLQRRLDHNVNGALECSPLATHSIRFSSLSLARHKALP